MSDDVQQSEEQQLDDAGLGFTAPEKPAGEKYDTQFLVGNLEKDKQRTKMIVLGVVIAVIGFIGLLLFMSSGQESPATRGTHAAPAAAATEKPAAPTNAPAADAPAAAPAAH